jgi:transposase
MANVPYTKEQIAFIEVHHAGITAAELTELFNDAFHESRSKNGIQYLLQKKGWKYVKRPNTWADGFTTEQKEFMQHHGANMSRRELAELFNSHFGTSVCLSTIKGWCGRNKIPSPKGEYTQRTISNFNQKTVYITWLYTAFLLA